MERAISRPANIRVSRFTANDRARVRALCADAAYEGRPLEEWLPLDRELFADIFTAYYTDFEPESSFVAWADETFAGYVLTALDTTVQERVWKRHILLPTVWRVVTGRYRIPLSTLPPLIRLGAAYLRCGSLRTQTEEYPGHLHINIAQQYRRFPVLTRKLLHRAIQHFKDNEVPGVHGIVMTARAHMERKYEHVGFRILARCTAPRPSPRARGSPHWLLIGMRLDSLSDRPFSGKSMRQRSRTGSLAGDHKVC